MGGVDHKGVKYAKYVGICIKKNVIYILYTVNIAC